MNFSLVIFERFLEVKKNGDCYCLDRLSVCLSFVLYRARSVPVVVISIIIIVIITVIVIVIIIVINNNIIGIVITIINITIIVIIIIGAPWSRGRANIVTLVPRSV